jgi:hypothetical protein
MRVGEAQAFGGEPIDVRRFDARRAIASDIAVAQVIGIDEHDVRPRRIG